MSYWDTSCLIKLYAPEPDSRIFRDFLEADTACVTCDLTPLEFWAAVRRKGIRRSSRSRRGAHTSRRAGNRSGRWVDPDDIMRSRRPQPLR